MAKRKRKEYGFGDTPHFRQMNRGVDKMFGKKPDDPDQSHWIIVIIIFLALGFILASLKKH